MLIYGIYAPKSKFIDTPVPRILELSLSNQNSSILYCYSLATRLTGHTAELSNCLWNFDESMIGTSSIDATARLWDIRGVHSSHTIDGHNDEVLDICFNYTGKIFATCSNDCTCKIWNIQNDFELISTMTGHTDEISKVRSVTLSTVL